MSFVRRVKWALYAQLNGWLAHVAPDITPVDLAIWRRVQPHTMTSLERVLGLIEGIRYLVRSRIEGDIVECGVWRGGSMMAAALTLKETGDESRQLYLYDTYVGNPEGRERDRDWFGRPAEGEHAKSERKGSTWLKASLDDVKANMARTEYPSHRIHCVVGMVESTIPREAPEKIALLRLDTNFYDSNAHVMRHLYPRLVPGGILLLDDYGYWTGARDAVDEYFSATKEPIYLARLDATGRVAVKLLS